MTYDLTMFDDDLLDTPTTKEVVRPLGWREEYAGMPEFHNSDVQLFLRCRRKWNFQSPHRGGLESIDAQHGALWFGTGFHFSMEDYHGYKRFANPTDAFTAYVNATRSSDLPTDYKELFQTGIGMFDYYQRQWLPRRNIFDTYWVDGKPQVEVDFVVKIPGIDATYGGTFDRIVVDSEGRLWVFDYKTAKSYDSQKFATDAQIGRYTWAASQLYGLPFEGCIWQQHVKSVPEMPSRLKNGGFSKDKRQHTTYGIYRKALVEEYGDVPSAYNDLLNELMMQETPDGDRYIRRDVVRRNQASCDAEAEKMYWISRDMMDANLPLYPNPTRDCSWDCPFRTPCIMMDDGADWEDTIDIMYRPRHELREWRSRVKWPDGIVRATGANMANVADWLEG